MEPAKCEERKCPRHMITDGGLDVCIIENTVKGIGVMPVFNISEKNCRILRKAPVPKTAFSKQDNINPKK